MVFNSIPFVIFFAIVFLTYWLIGRCERGVTVQNIFLVLASFVFYGWWDWRFLLLIMVCIAVSYYTAIRIEKGNHRRGWMIAGVTVNLALLAFFKYFNFFRDNAVVLLKAIGVEADWVTLEVLLPVGISFYTLQAIGYCVDVYRRDVRAQRNALIFTLFLSYFPQLVSGPIESARSLMPQLERKRQWDYGRIVAGMQQALWGFVKKIVIADNCGMLVDGLFANDPDNPLAWRYYAEGIVLFSIQIYCDFSGYCDIARGVSTCLGIDIMQNFRLPFFAENVGELWRRWNVSLMRWFKLYVYIPLGGSRRGLLRTCINVFVVFLLSGLWHGASWNFIMWGVYWGVVMVGYRIIKSYFSTSWLPRYVGMISTVYLGMVGWGIFLISDISMILVVLRASAIPLAMLALAAIAVGWGFNRLRLPRWVGCAIPVLLLVSTIAFKPYDVQYYVLAAIVGMFVWEWNTRHLDCPLWRLPSRRLLRVAVYWALIALVLTNISQNIPFIYFQF